MLARGHLLLGCALWLAGVSCGNTEHRGTAPGVAATSGNPSGGATAGAAAASDAGSSLSNAGAPNGGASSAGAGVGGQTVPACEGGGTVCVGNARQSCENGQLELTDCGEGFVCEPGPIYANCIALEQPEVATTKNEFGFAWRDAYLLMPCIVLDNPGFITSTCTTIAEAECPNQNAATFEGEKGYVLKETFEIGGNVGTTYVAHLVVNGVVEGKYYEGGTRDAGEAISDASTPADAFYRGGSPIASPFSVYRLSVRDAKGVELEHYYLNSFPQASNFESHQTVVIGYEKDIDVPGGGSIEYMSQVSNCRVWDNCGPGDPTCTSRNIPNEPGLQLPATWRGKPLSEWNVVTGAQQPFHANIIHVRVSKIALKPPAP